MKSLMIIISKKNSQLGAQFYQGIQIKKSFLFIPIYLLLQFDEIPQSFSGISSISVTNPGAGYTSQPTITIDGDGTGANAYATIVNGNIQSITIENRGIDYTRATVTITGGGGSGAIATCSIETVQKGVIYFTMTNSGYGYKV